MFSLSFAGADLYVCAVKIARFPTLVSFKSDFQKPHEKTTTEKSTSTTTEGKTTTEPKTTTNDATVTTIEPQSTSTEAETTTSTEVKTTVPIKINHDKDFGPQKPLSPVLSRPEDVSETRMGGCPKSRFKTNNFSSKELCLIFRSRL